MVTANFGFVVGWPFGWSSGPGCIYFGQALQFFDLSINAIAPIIILACGMWVRHSKLINLARRGVMTNAMTPAQRAAFSESEVLLATSELDPCLPNLQSDGRRVDLAVPGFALALHYLPLHYLCCLPHITPLVCPKAYWLSAVPHRLCSLSEQG